MSSAGERHYLSLAYHLSTEKRLQVLAALVDGTSERATERMTDVSAKTIRKFALRMGEGSQRLHDRLIRDLRCWLVQMDEIWSYVGKKQKRITPGDPPEFGDAYTFVAMESNSRLAISFHVGKRDQKNTDLFMQDLRSRVAVMPKMMTSDGFRPYISAVKEEFGRSIDYGQMVKNYTKNKGRRDNDQYEPPREPFITKKTIYGAPDHDLISTAYIERNNCTMRHFIGRMRRRCLAYSKKIENHRAAVALNYVHYNFCHVVSTLRVTPAMQAGITDHVWDLEEFMDAVLTEEEAGKPKAKSLEHPKPETPARELPNGRGWLRVVK